VQYGTFVERVRNNLHLVLCMSPVGDQLRVRCRKFPSLVDCCTLDWFAAWPEEALISVSKSILQAFPQLNMNFLPGLTLMCKDIHLQSTAMAEKFEAALKRKVYNTPKSFLDFINLFKKLFEEKKDEL